MKTILDVSNIVYGGHYGTPDWRISGFPLGGVRKLMGIINSSIKQSDMIICFDGSGTIKRELMPRYKAGRVPNYSVLAQIDLLKEILLDCDIPFYYDDSYEADDLICSVVHLLSRFDTQDNITIYSDDRDMACCVSDFVKIQNVTSQGICLNRTNFESRVVQGETIPYNTILLYKMINGDKSDNYPGLKIPGLRFDLVAHSMIEELRPFLESGQMPDAAFMDLRVINVIIDSLPDLFTVEMKEAMKAQAKIVFPQLIDVTRNGEEALFEDLNNPKDSLYQIEKNHLKMFGLGDFNRAKFDYYCCMLNLNRCHPDRFSSQFVTEAEEFKSSLRMKAKELSNGTMAVEKYSGRKVAPSSSTVLENMQLPI